MVPPIRGFEDTLIEYGRDHERNREMIRRFDEIMLEKANKSNLTEIYDSLLKFLGKEEFTHFESKCVRDIQHNAEQIKRIETMIDSMGTEINNEIFGAVKRATLHITSKIGARQEHAQKESVGKELLEQLLEQKADKDEVDALFDMKTNKVDMQNQMKSTEILHNQLKQLLILIVEVIKSLINTNETKNAVLNKR